MLRLEPSSPWAGIFGSDCGQHRSWGGHGSLEKTMSLPTLGAAGPFPSLCWDKARRMLGEPHPQGKDGRVGGICTSLTVRSGGDWAKHRASSVQP